MNDLPKNSSQFLCYYRVLNNKKYIRERLKLVEATYKESSLIEPLNKKLDTLSVHKFVDDFFAYSTEPDYKNHKQPAPIWSDGPDVTLVNLFFKQLTSSGSQAMELTKVFLEKEPSCKK